jgi:hypothetical protein
MHTSITNGRGLDAQLLVAYVGRRFSGFLAAAASTSTIGRCHEVRPNSIEIPN